MFNCKWCVLMPQKIYLNSAKEKCISANGKEYRVGTGRISLTGCPILARQIITDEIMLD